MQLQKRKGGITMALVEYKLKDKDNLTEEDIKVVEAGRKKSVVFDDDSPEITPEMMKRAYRPGRAKSTKKMVSMYMEEADIEYFKSMSKDTGIPYQTLISMYLTDCRKTKRTFNPVWEEPA